MQAIDFIGINWGGKTFRAWAMSDEGFVAESLSTERGLKSVQNGEYEKTLREICGPWLSAAPSAPLLICGMAGARGGWAETAYAPCPVRPADLPALAARLTVAGRPALILPGAMDRDADGHTDVMRGEEVQVLGIAELSGVADARICIPGTHNKWACLKDGALSGFRTFVTGELFALLRNNSLVGALAEDDTFDHDAFIRGVRRGASAPLANAVFAARADTLNKTLAPDALSSFLSGTLIGGEIAAQSGRDSVLLVASGLLKERYELALGELGNQVRTVDPTEATRWGLALAARTVVGERVGNTAP